MGFVYVGYCCDGTVEYIVMKMYDRRPIDYFLSGPLRLSLAAAVTSDNV